MQNTLLTYDDLETWFWCVLNMQAVGFYNSDPAAGSSQRHKHMQLVPLDSIRKMYPTSVASSQTALPVEKLIFPRIQSGEWKVYNPIAAEDAVQTLPEVSADSMSCRQSSSCDSSGVHDVCSSPFHMDY